jgi:drug/metabolite transporter (DMT)-like permease
MGLLDGVAGIMQVFAATYLSGSMLILVTQSSIPISMLISKKLLRTKYSRSQYLGAITVAFGVLFVLGPTLNGGSGGGSTLLWSTVLVLSCVPMVLSSVYKEIALGESELDPIYLNGWVAVFQFLVSVPLAVPSALAGDPAVYPSELPANLWAGLKCYVGIDTVVGGIHADNCWPAAPSYVNMYLVFNMACEFDSINGTWGRYPPASIFYRLTSPPSLPHLLLLP